ncbi:putative glycosyltransferase [Cavenderia fasciculata]|uniref:Glycosyltransferase n=1 Tax=Cavenderia fasciculata TaxID=261658 RepID=F4Q3N5_CACFS|nr:putative glycosyltransferase [Cavenderia fasciculata]EGG17693.1 putative glycosyltransferase [Cavenderia fasciculata]|eukprot:XP_004356177.1 putative glycosyltransferase [Cavenderia fasciculata]
MNIRYQSLRSNNAIDSQSMNDRGRDRGGIKLKSIDHHNNNNNHKSEKEINEELIERQKNRIPSDDFLNGIHQPFNIVPFFHRAYKYQNNNINNNNNNNNNNRHEQSDDKTTTTTTTNTISTTMVTIVTQATVDRIERVVAMAKKWKGPISTAVFIKNPKDIPQLKKLLRKHWILAEYVDIHLLYANHTRYPVNNLRNLSIKYAQSDYVLLMDADFVPHLGMNEYVSAQIETLLQQQQQQQQNKHPLSSHEQQQQEEKIAFVVPSFASSENPNHLPNDKQSLLKMIKENKVYPTNLNVCPKCHTPTNYSRWYETDDLYQVEYRWIYEPYLIFNRSTCLAFDERLKGYGFDKNSQVFTMAAQGFKFMVLQAFIIHINHPAASWEGPSLDEQQWDSLRIVPITDVTNNTE